ncbi:hypothetical protein BDV95DRAFT_595555 [Massariosphaeria phaeospora]|uniref:Uncharacterized protein n=1 Tax=Massariosphaeria phaeospora TaxID=100035 RepID=A0A7C8MB16_9PLEO|nr:hypothetical protein BDV95DRAFT_595555 [Massariosphaeria phaeospora]
MENPHELIAAPHLVCPRPLRHAKLLVAQLRKHSYDNIALLECKIQHHDEQLRNDGTAKWQWKADPLSWYSELNHLSHLAYAIESRQEAVELLQLLRDKWREIALRLREESRKLFVLPRELRDSIYALLYTYRVPVKDVYYTRDSVPRVVLRRDPYLYLNASVVDPVIASEAAQMVFFANKFNVIAHSGAKMMYNFLSHFLHTDHFASTIKPSQTFLRQLTVTFPGRDLYHPTYPDFEQGRPLSKKAKYRIQKRKNTPCHLDSLLDLPHLEHLTLQLTNINTFGWAHVEYRDIAPTIKTLKRRGVRARVLALGENWWNKRRESTDVSDLFDDPSQEDGIAFGTTPFAQLAELERRAWIRVWLARHAMESGDDTSQCLTTRATTLE